MTLSALDQNIAQSTVLTKIVHDKQIWLTKRKAEQPLASFQSQIVPSDRSFYQSLRKSQCVFILECKKASPSKGLIRDDFDPQIIAQCYRDDAAAISVLTDEKYFQGSFDFLPIVRHEVSQPVLCKDFIIDEYQIYLARYYQADAILLMLSILNDEQYSQFSNIAHQLNMGVLTEASTQDEVERAVRLQAQVIGVNNRNLRDLSVDLNRVKQLAPLIPRETIVISESGIHTHQQVLELSQYANGFLIGSALMSQPNLKLAIKKVIFGENKVCGLTRLEDAQAVAQAGAVYGGLIFVPSSPRYVTPQQAQLLSQSVSLNWVGVFRAAKIDQVVRIATELNLYAVQLHGQVDNVYINQLRQQLPKNCQIWQALTIKESIPNIADYAVDRLIFDNGQGGTGQAFNWQLSTNQSLQRVMLAGGINLENVKQALSIGYLGLDINSGAESAPGIKDSDKLNTLFSIIRSYPYSKSA